MGHWVVYVATDKRVHVLPWCDRVGVDHEPHVARGHVPVPWCWCFPSVLREGPLSVPRYSHREPSWPGAEGRLS